MGVSESEDEPIGDEPVDDECEMEDGSVDDSEEEEEDVPNYEADGFVVDEEEGVVSDGESHDSIASVGESSAVRRKKKKRKTKEPQFDDEDLSWLEEDNTVMGRGRKGRKLKKANLEMAARLDMPRNRNAQTFEELEDFHGEIEDEVSPFRSGGSARRSFHEEEMDMDGFIVDESINRDERRSKRTRDKELTPAYEEALQEVAEIFGEADELIAMYEQARRDTRVAINATHQAMKDSSLNPSQPAHLEDCDPEALARHCLLPEDDAIRRKDVPERFQYQFETHEAELDFDIAAEWIYETMFRQEPKTLESELIENGQLEIDGPDEEEEYCGRNTEALCRGHRTHDQKVAWLENKEAQQRVKASISKVLRHVYEDLEEIPYIATYKKSSCGDLLCLAADEVPTWTSLEEYNEQKQEGSEAQPPGSVQSKDVKMKRWKLLWTVFDLSLKWRRLQSRIQKRIQIYTQLQEEHQDEQNLIYSLQKCIEQMTNAKSTEDADLADRRFRLAMAFSKKKIPRSDLLMDSRTQRHAAYTQLGYGAIVDGMDIRLLLRLEIRGRDATMTDRPLCYTRSHQDVIADIMEENKGSVGVDAVLLGARHMAAIELACHQDVRMSAKKLYETYATITTTVTPVGEKVLDPFHVFGTVKRLVDKPITTFQGDQFLRIIGATRKGYMNYTLQIKEHILEEQMVPALMTDVLTTRLEPLQEGWEDFRRDVIRELAKEHLFPLFRKEMTQKLSEKARSCVLNKMSEGLWKFITQRPYKPVIEENSYDEHDSSVRVCACCWGQGGRGQPSTVLVMLTGFGELTDFLELNQFSGFSEPAPFEDAFNVPDVLQDENKKEDAQRVREFLMEHKPHVVVVGAAHMACRQLVTDLELIRDHFLTEHSRFMVSIQGNMEVLLVSETIPAVWENSPAANAELPDHSSHVRRAVALGRCLIDPLSVVASLRDHSDSILSCNFCDLQEWLTKEEKLARMDEVLVTAMNQLGGELNLMTNVEWRSHALQFICGLGKRKAMGLLRVLGKKVESRADLMNHDAFGSIVLRNCIGFLIINDLGLPGLANLEIDPLDETRIHVDHYSLAKELAMLAVEVRDGDAALIELMEKPELIKTLDLEWFNRRGMNRGRNDRLSILIDIGMELYDPFWDRRPPFAKHNELEIFYLLANEKAETMKPGKLVEAVVQNVEDYEIQCQLVQSRLKGSIKKDQYSSEENSDAVDLKTRVRRGSILRARLLGIEYKDFFVELSCRSLDLQNDERWEREYCTDAFYHVKTEEEKEQERLSKEAKQEKRVVTRRIDHPLFKNISEAECVEILSKSPLGHTIFRPSRSGFQFITVSFNAFTGKHGDICLHRDLMEAERKDPVRFPSFKLNLPLTMMLTRSRKMTFDDLDEVVPCFVDPYIDRVKTLKMHRKFRDGFIQEVDQIVNADKRLAGHNQGVYVLGVDYNRPGCFYLAAVLNQNVRREGFVILPDGYYYRKQVFRTLESMVDEFKRNPYPPMAIPQIDDASRELQGRPGDNWQTGPSGNPRQTRTPNSESDDDMRF